MPIDATSRLNGAALGEKVAKLSAFIVRDLEARAQHGLQPGSDCYLLIARSPDSPVAQALRANAKALAAAGVTVRAIFSEAEPIRADALKAPFAAPSECRAIRDQRLLSAHEQLVLAPDCAWIGDCMRREPSKRDTYERFAVDPADAAFATASFERLWRAAGPVRVLPSLPGALASHLSGIAHQTLRPESFRRQ